MVPPQWLAAATCGMLAALAGAAPLPEAGANPPAADNLAAIVQAQATEQNALETKSAEADATLRKWYEGAVEAVKKDAQSKGQLDGVLAADNERGRLDRDLSAEEKGQLPAVLRPVRAQYDQARLQRAAQLKSALAANWRVYLATLEGLEKRLTIKGDIDGAVAARQERASTAEKLKALTAAAAPPPNPAGQPARVALSPQPPALALAGPTATPVIPIASELRSYGTVQTPHKDAIGFNTPTGFGHTQGGRGVLYKSESGSSRKGSTWSFTWTFSGTFGNGTNGVQMVHPFNGGHVIVQLRAFGPQPASVYSWGRDAWSGGGDPKFFKDTDEAAKFFPLKLDQKYAIVGQLNAKGDYTLSIDGQVVATGSFNTPSHLSLYTFPKPLVLGDGFAGENLPMKWRAGYAALLVGPAKEEGAGNLCQGITFQPSAP